MSATHSVIADPVLDLVRITLSGFFSPEAIAAFLAEFHAAHALLRCAPNAHLTFLDVRELSIQSQEAVGRFASVLADPRFRARRLACVAASTLARSQLNRALADRPGSLVFVEPAEAEAWLLADAPTSRAA